MDIVIFGISGDLAEKKLIPALLELHSKMKFPNGMRLFGFSRTFKHLKHLTIPFEYQHVMGSYDSPTDMKILKELLRPEVKQLFYFALPPDASKNVLVSLSVAGLVSTNDAPRSRVVLIEKPFGKGYRDAEDLITYINTHFLPDQILKVDHYAGKKEMRDRDTLSALISPPRRIKKVTFEILETGTVENRGGYYDSVGALRDVGQNHLLFMLATLLQGDKKREDVLENLRVDPDTSHAKFGSYAGYDKIETFFSVSALYQDMVIELRSGKALSKNGATFTIQYEGGEEKKVVLTSGTSAYEHILEDAIMGNSESFISDREVLAAWKFTEELEKIKENAKKNGLFINYPLGSDAETLL